VQGMTLNRDGYLRIKRRGPLRDQLAHRAYCARQMYLDKLPACWEVHHVCMNRSCFPPTDYHLCIVDEALAPYMYQTHARRASRKNKKRT
jgi:hypothetical protein